MLSCHDVANYFLAQTREEEGDLISNMKLQKLLYYAQGYYLAMEGEPLFLDPIVKWQHGPVVEEVFERFKECGSSGIPLQPLDISAITAEKATFLDDVYQTFGQYSAGKLRTMTHNEAPWKQTTMGSEITKEVLADYFTTVIASHETQPQ